jgi:hypothetical protein
VALGASSLRRAGSGVFACKSFKAGDVVTVVGNGEYLLKAEHSGPAVYGLDFEVGSCEVMFRGAGPACSPGDGLATMINSSGRRANVEFVVYNNRLYVQGTRHISAGDELLAVYRFNSKSKAPSLTGVGISFSAKFLQAAPVAHNACRVCNCWRGLGPCMVECARCRAVHHVGCFCKASAHS